MSKIQKRKLNLVRIVRFSTTLRMCFRHIMPPSSSRLSFVFSKSHRCRSRLAFPMEFQTVYHQRHLCLEIWHHRQLTHRPQSQRKFRGWGVGRVISRCLLWRQLSTRLRFSLLPIALLWSILLESFPQLQCKDLG